MMEKLRKHRIAVVNVDFEDASAGALARRLFFYGLNQGHEMYAFYGRGDRFEYENVIKFEPIIEVYVHKLLALLTGKEGFYSNFSTYRLLRFFDKLKFDTVILIQAHGYYLNEYKFFKYLKKHHIKVIYVTSDEYAGLGKCCYSLDCVKYKSECEKCPLKRDYPKSLLFDRANLIWRKKQEAYDGLDVSFIGPRTNIDKFYKSALLKYKKLFVADWGIDTDFYRYYGHDEIYDKYTIPRKKIYILTVAPYSMERKGVKKYFFEVAKRIEDERFHFINVGYDGDPSIDTIPSNMTTIPFVKDQKELAKIYSLADLYVLASTQDTMPLSCLISFACETPVCCFYISGLRYLAEDGVDVVNFSYEINVEGLLDLIKNTEKKSPETRNECRQYAIDRYSVNIFNRKVFDVIENEDRNTRC